MVSPKFFDPDQSEKLFLYNVPPKKLFYLEEGQ